MPLWEFGLQLCILRVKHALGFAPGRLRLDLALCLKLRTFPSTFANADDLRPDATFCLKTPKTTKKTKTTKNQAVKSAKELEFDAKEAKRMNAMFDEANDFNLIFEAIPAEVDYDPSTGSRSSGARRSTYANSSIRMTNDDSFFHGLSRSHDVSLNVFSPVLHRSILRAQPLSAVGDGEKDIRLPASKSQRINFVIEDKTLAESISGTTDEAVLILDETQKSDQTLKSVRFDPRSSVLTATENTMFIEPVDKTSSDSIITLDKMQMSIRTRSNTRDSTMTAVENTIGVLMENETQPDESLFVSDLAIRDTILARSMIDDTKEDFRSPKSLRLGKCDSSLTTFEDSTIYINKQNPKETKVTLDETFGRMTRSRSGRFDPRFSTLTAKEETTLKCKKGGSSTRVDSNSSVDGSDATFAADGNRAKLKINQFDDSSFVFDPAMRAAILVQSTIGDEEEGKSQMSTTSSPDEWNMLGRSSKSVRFDPRCSISTAIEDATVSIDKQAPNETAFSLDKTQTFIRMTRSRSARFYPRFSTLAAVDVTIADKNQFNDSLCDSDPTTCPTTLGQSMVGNAEEDTGSPILKSLLLDSRLSTVKGAVNVGEKTSNKTITTVDKTSDRTAITLDVDPHSATMAAGINTTFAIVSKRDASARVVPIVLSSSETLLSGGTPTAGDDADEPFSDDDDSDDEPLQINTLHQFYYLRDFNGVSANINYVLHICGQQAVATWFELSPDGFADCKKIGEGTYGEVFKTVVDGEAVALKVIPFVDEVVTYDGLVNGERMKHTLEILPEMLITRELSSLAIEQPELKAGYATPSFIRIVRMSIVQGNYAPRLLREWDKFARRTENDRPDVYSSPEQLFIVFAMSLGGKDLESYTIKNEREAFSIFFQLALSLIVAEETLEFEHRDLHWGNVLINNCAAAEPIRYLIDGQEVVLRASNVRVAIIDFTNSRMRREETTIFLDLSTDEELFKGHGDYQFEIYRMMREHCRDDWVKFSPYTNVLWMDYIASKVFNAPKIPAWRRKEIIRTFGGLRKAERLAAFLREPPIAEVFENYLIR